MRSLASAAAIAALCVLGSCSGDPPPPNLVIVALDTLRPDHLGFYGHERDTSPNLDRWAAQAVVFDNAQSAAPWTAPALLSLMTSLHPYAHGVLRFPHPGAMNERVTTLAEVLKERGYATAAFTDGGYAKPHFGLRQGFDVYPLNEGDLLDHKSNIEHFSRIEGNVDRTLKWLDEVEDDGDPFFLFFHTYEIHGPYRPKESYVRLFRPGWDEAEEHARLEATIERWTAARQIDGDDVRLMLAHLEHCKTASDPAYKGLGPKLKEFGVSSVEEGRMQFWRDLYDGEIRWSDEQLARLLARLESEGLRENTVVVVVSDHGEGFGEHGVAGHGGVLHEENLRIVLAMRAPGIAPRRVADVVRSIDVMPTALELLGAPLDGLALQGRSLVPLLRGEPLPAAPTFSHAMAGQGREGRLWSVREGRWRFVWDDERALAQLFDLEADPGELRDVAAEHPETFELLRGKLRAQIEIDRSFHERAAGPVGPLVLSESERKQFEAELDAELRALGYTDGAEPPFDPSSTPPLPLPPPKLR
jgi:arylsulfatase A-like enzyme